MSNTNQKLTRTKRSSAKGKFHRVYNLLKAEQDKGSVDVEVIIKILEDLEQSYVDLEDKHTAHLETLDPDEDDKFAMTAINTDMDEMYSELCAARSILASRKREEIKAITENDVKSQPRDKLMVKKLEAPTFSGSIRDYPTFKRDYAVHMQPSFGKDPYALRSCLIGKALETVQGVGDSYEEMMDRPESRHGCSEKLVDAVLMDLSKLKKIPDGDNIKLLRFIEVVEQSWLDLKGMGLKEK